MVTTEVQRKYLQSSDLIDHVLMLWDVLHAMQLYTKNGLDLALASPGGIVHLDVAKGRRWFLLFGKLLRQCPT
jgi:hypothetical protein